MSHFTNAPQAATHRLRPKGQEDFFTDGLEPGSRRWTLRGNLMDSTLPDGMALVVMASRPPIPAKREAEVPYHEIDCMDSPAMTEPKPYPPGDARYGGVLVPTNQVGGDHYDRMPVDVFQFCEVNGLGFVESTAIKYIARRKSESRIEDLQKAISCIQRLIKHEETSSWER